MKKSNTKMYIFFLLVLSFIFSGMLYSLTIKDASIEELTAESDLIVRGTVNSMEYKWENENLKKINTIVNIDVREYYKGNGKNNIQIVQMGGKINDIEDIIIGTPRFNLKEEVMFFLIEDNKQYKIHSIALGCYKIKTNDKLQKMAVNELNDIHLIEKDSNQYVARNQIKKNILLSDLSKKIRDVVNK